MRPLMTHALAAATAVATALGSAGLAVAQTHPAPAGTSMGAATPSMGTAMQSSDQPPASGSTGAAATTPGSSSTPNSAQQADASPAVVEQAQQQLKSQGLYRGPIDGRIGLATQLALSHFQRKAGLPATAMLDSRTLQHLLPDANSGASTTPGR